MPSFKKKKCYSTRWNLYSLQRSTYRHKCFPKKRASKHKTANLSCCILSFGWFLGVRILHADVSEHCVFHRHRCELLRLPMTMKQTRCSETSAYKIQTPESLPKERIQHPEHGESLKSRTAVVFGHCCKGRRQGRSISAEFGLHAGCHEIQYTERRMNKSTYYYYYYLTVSLCTTCK